MIILDMKKPASCETCPLHWNEQGMMCCGVTHDVVRENCPIKAEIPDNATNKDVMKAVFPDEIVTHNANLIWYGDLFMCNDKWWNALYQKGGKE